MPQLDAILIGERYRAALEARQREALSRLIAAYRVTLGRLDGYITALESELSAMEGSGQKPKVWKVKRLERYEELKKQIEGEITRYAALLEAEIDAGARDAIAQAERESRDTARASLPGVDEIDTTIMSRWNVLPAGAVEAMIGFLSPDSPLRERLRTMLGPSVAELVADKLIEGIGLGYNPRKVAGIIRRELGQGLAWSLRTARTSMIYAHREALRAHYVANQEIVPKYQRIAVMDSRTCLACIALSGTEYPITVPLSDHYNGRCSERPIPLTYRELGIDVDEPPDADTYLRGLPEDEQKRLVGSKRWDAWSKGDIRFSETGRQWFERQSEAVQRAMMGPGKHDAWKSGKIGFDDMVDWHDDAVYGRMSVEASLTKMLGDLVGAIAGDRR